MCNYLDFVAILTASKGSSPAEVSIGVSSFSGIGTVCTSPAQLPSTNVKSTRCEVASGIPICCGGGQWVGGAYFDICWTYSHSTNTWTQFPGQTLSEPRSNGYAVELQDGRLWYSGNMLHLRYVALQAFYIIAIHYSTGGVGSNTSDILDPVAGTITPGPNLQTILYKHRVVRRPSDGLLFVLGGKASYPEHERPDHNRVDSFDIDTNTWTALANLTEGKFGPGVIMTDDESKIICAAGKGYLAPSYFDDFTAEIYDVASDTWFPIAPLPVTTYAYTFVKIADTMTALTNAANVVYQYDMAMDVWNLMPNVVTDAVNFDTIVAYLGDDFPYCT